MQFKLPKTGAEWWDRLRYLASGTVISAFFIWAIEEALSELLFGLFFAGLRYLGVMPLDPALIEQAAYLASFILPFLFVAFVLAVLYLTYRSGAAAERSDNSAKYRFFRSRYFVVTSFTGVICLAIVAWIFFVGDAPDKTVTAGNAPPPSTPCRKIPPEALVVLFGSNAAWITNDTKDLITFFDQPVLQAVQYENSSQLAIVGLRLYGPDNELMAYIGEHVEWLSQEISAERPDERTVLMRDSAGAVVFLVEYVSERVLRVEGIYKHPKLRGPLVIGKESAQFPPPVALNMTRFCFERTGIAVDETGLRLGVN